MSAAVLDGLLGERHSCRAFLPEPVPRETIERIFSTAQRTASWCNSQPWQVTIASGQAVQRLGAELLDAHDQNAPGASDLPFPSAYRGAYHARRLDCALRLYGAVGVARGDREASARQTRENFRFFGAPHVAILSSAADLGVYGAVDVGGYVQVLLLAMQENGVAAIAQAALAIHSGRVKQALGMPPERTLVCGVSFGYEDPSHPANSFRTARAPLDEVVTWRD